LRSDVLFHSLQQRAFGGELFDEARADLLLSENRP